MKSNILKGIFGNKKILLEQYLQYGNNTIVLNIHGAFGKTNDKYRRFATGIYNTGKASVILGSSSREDLTDLSSDMDQFKLKQSLFSGKTIKDEVKDFEIIINYILEESENLIGVEKENLKIILNGNSLGGIVSLYLGNKYKQVKALSLVGTGARLYIGGTTLLDSWPNILDLKDLCKGFNGNILLNYGTEDIVFDEKAFIDFYNLLQEKKSFVKYIGVDHSFKKVNGEKSKIPYDYITQNILKLIDGELISGEVILSNNENNLLTENIQRLDNNKLLEKDEDGFWE